MDLSLGLVVQLPYKNASYSISITSTNLAYFTMGVP